MFLVFPPTLEWLFSIKYESEGLLLCASQQESLHWLAPRKWLMHLVYIITNVLFALQLNCDCYVQSMRKGHEIAAASALMEKSMRIHFNHCGCCQNECSAAPRCRQWAGNYSCLYRLVHWQFRDRQISCFFSAFVFFASGAVPNEMQLQMMRASLWVVAFIGEAVIWRTFVCGGVLLKCCKLTLAWSAGRGCS